MYGDFSHFVAVVYRFYRATATVTELYNVPAVLCNKELNEFFTSAIQEAEPQVKFVHSMHAMGSEDFASFTYALPCAYLLLGAGTPQEDPRYGKPMHNEAVVFNEDVLPTGAALHTLFALRMLAQET